MSRELTYAEQVAPYPKSDDPAVAVKLARCLACFVQADFARTSNHHYLSAPLGDKAAAREYSLLICRMVGNYSTLSLLRTLIAADLDLATGTASRLVDDLAGGEAVGEKVWDWLREYGIDPDKVAADLKPFERIEAAA